MSQRSKSLIITSQTLTTIIIIFIVTWLPVLFLRIHNILVLFLLHNNFIAISCILSIIVLIIFISLKIRVIAKLLTHAFILISLCSLKPSLDNVLEDLPPIILGADIGL